ncbi:MAG: hypothetical protein JEZ10_09150 [Verrucomicrobia bacterium]|nr:hypothetical protein [Verrucomicrobiota bacterium]
MKKLEKSLKKIYRQNPKTEAVLIEVALGSYEEIFNEWDPAPYQRRDLNPALHRYLEESADEIPLRHPVELLFKARPALFDETKERRSKEGLATYLFFMMNEKRKALRRLYRFSLLLLGAAAVTLTGASYLSKLEQPGMLIALLNEGLVIGSWVFSWELISLSAFQRFVLKRELKKWERMAGAELKFVYGE